MIAETQQAFADALLEGLHRNGCRNVVLSPGSRSTPLALAAERLRVSGHVHVHVVVDERAAGFLALGVARATAAPVALVCTSGSAPFHYLPALLEAATAYVPLLLLSADRPARLHGRGAHQTVPQHTLLDPFARRRWNVEPVLLGGPDLAASEARRLAEEAHHVATEWRRPGPVHINVRFHKPLEPPVSWPSPPAIASDTKRSTRKDDEESEVVAMLRGFLLESERPLVILGPRAHGDSGPFVGPLPPFQGLPLAPETASGCRFLHGTPGDALVGRFDAWLRSETMRAELPADRILQIGAVPLSSGFGRLVAERAMPRLVLCAHGWPDPWRSAEAVLQTPRPLRALARALRQLPPSRIAAWRSWIGWLQRCEWAAGEAVDAVLERLGPGSEGAAVRSTVRAAAEAGARLLVGNSLPVRQLDLWCAAGPPARQPLPVMARRGVAGIDGTLSEAVGVALEEPSRAPLVLLIGDTTFRHDQGALELLTQVRRPLAVVILDNGGGRIFEELPLGAMRDRPVIAAAMASSFRTSGGPDPVALAAAYGMTASRIEHAGDLDATLREAFRNPAPHVLRFVVSDDPVRSRREAFEAVDAALRPLREGTNP